MRPRSRLAAALGWLRGRADSALGRLVLLWFRRYFEASRKSAAAASTYITLSVLPTALVIVAIFNLAKGDENAFADRLISHMNLSESTASVVHDLFGTTANNVLAASITIVIGFLLWGSPSASSTRTSTRGLGAFTRARRPTRCGSRSGSSSSAACSR